jgi:hypothetical protein
MDTVWVRGQGDVLIRADSIVVLAMAHDGLRAECVNGRTVRLTDSACDSALQLALLEEIRHAGADERWPVVIMPVGDRETPTWRRERVDTLIGRMQG